MPGVASVRSVFAGTPEFAVQSLTALVRAGFAVELVLTQPDRPAGRGRRLTPSPVKQAALSDGIPVLQPDRLDAAARAALPEPRPDLLVVVAYGLLLPQWLLDWPRVAALNVHASLLPRWRGASPIQQAILAGDAESGVSLMRMTRGLDQGPVYARRATAIAARETAGELHDRLARLGAELLLATLPGVLEGTLEPVPQPEAGASYAPRIDKRDARLDWTRPAAELERRIRAYNPWPIAESLSDSGVRLRIWEAAALPDGAGHRPGTVLAGTPAGIDVATGAGILRLTHVQPPGSRVMSAADYLAAHSLAGALLGG